MRRTEMLQEIRKMRFMKIKLRFEEVYSGWNASRLTQASFRRAPVDEVMALSAKYEGRYRGWNVKHFYSWYCRDGGSRSYSWVKNTLQARGLVSRASKRGVHRKRG